MKDFNMKAFGNGHTARDFSSVGVQSFNTMNYGYAPQEYERAKTYNEIAENVSEEIADIDYDKLAEQKDTSEDASSSTFGTLLAFTNPVVATGIQLARTAKDAIQNGETRQLYNSLVEKKLQTNVTNLQGDIVKNEGKTIPEIEFVKQYEEQLDQFNKITDPASKQDLSTYLAENEERYRQTILRNPELRSIYFDLGDANTSVDRSNMSVWDNIKYTANQIFASGKEDALSGAIDSGLVDYNNIQNLKYTAKAADKDRTRVLNDLDLLLPPKFASLETKQQELENIQSKLRQGTWYFNPDVLTPEFRKKVDENQLNFLDPSSIKYALPQIGSSLSEMGAMAGSFATSLAASKAAKALPGYGKLIGVAEAGINTWLTWYQRQAETNSEVFDSYSSRVINAINEKNVDFDKIITEGKQELSKLGLNTDKSEYDILNDMLVYNVATSSPVFEQIKRDSYNGLRQVEQSNMALGALDLLEASVFSYGGKAAMNSILKGTKLATAGSKLSKAAEAGKKFVDSNINKALLKITRSPGAANETKHLLGSLGSMAAKAGFIAISEGTEEGVQNLLQSEYQKGLYDKYRGEDATILESIGRNARLSVESNLALAGLHPDDALNNDNELIQSMKVGSLIGIIMGSSLSVASGSYNAYQQLMADNQVRQMSAHDFANRENDAKVDQFYNAAKRKKFEYLQKSLEDIRDNFLPEGVTAEDINSDIADARKINMLYHNPALNNNFTDLGVTRGTEKHRNILKNALKAMNVEETYRADTRVAAEDLNTALNNADDDSYDATIRTFYDQAIAQDPEYGVDYESYKSVFKQINQIQAAIKSLTKLNNQLKNRENFLKTIKDKEGLDVNLENIASIQESVKQDLKEHKSNLKDVADIIGVDPKDLSIEFNNSEEVQNAFAQSAVIKGLYKRALNRRMAYQNGFVLDFNYKSDINAPTWNTLSEEQKQEQIDKANKQAEEANEAAPSLNKIISRYNANIKKQFDIDGKKATASRQAANAIILKDLERFEKNQQSYEELAEEPSVEETPEVDFVPEVNPEKDDIAIRRTTDKYEDIYGEEVTTEPEKKTVVEEEVTEEDIPEDIDTEDGDSIESEPVKSTEPTPEEVDKSSQLEEQQEVVEETDEDPEPEPEPEDEPVTKQDVVTKKIDRTKPLSPSLFREEPEDVDLRGIEQGVEEKEFKEGTVKDKVQEGVEEKEFKEGSVVKKTKVEQPATQAPEQTPDPVPAPEARTGTSIPDNSRYGIDEQGNVLLDGKPVDPAKIEFADAELQFLDQDGSKLDALTESAKKDPASVKGVSTSQTLVAAGKVGKTLFYLPDAVKPLDLPFKLPHEGKLNTGEELAHALADPTFLDRVKDEGQAYFAIGKYGKNNTFNPNDITTFDSADIYLIIKLGDNVYATALRKPKDAETFYLRRGEKNVDDVNRLKDFRNKIISAYFQGRTDIPTTALTHVVPTSMNRTNGVFNTQKDADGNPVYRKLNEVKTFAIPEDPYALLDEVTFGYGTGIMSELNPMAINSLDKTVALADRGGYSGSIYIFPKVENTPSRRYSAPIMLSEKFFRNPNVTSPEEVQLYDKQKGIKKSFPEYIYDLLVGNVEDRYGILNIIVNNGDHTSVSNKLAKKANFLVAKQLFFDPETNTLRLGVKNENTGRYESVVLKVDQIERSKQLKREVIYNIMQNYHWNTDVDAMIAPVSEQLRDLMIQSQKDKLVLFPGELEFTKEDLGIKKVGSKLVKDREEAPSLLNWMIRSGKLMTDVGEQAFNAPFLYVNDIQVDETKLPKQEVKEKEEVKQPGQTAKPSQSRAAKFYNQLGKADSNSPKVNRLLTKEEAQALNMRTPKGMTLYYDANGKLGLMATPQGVYSDSTNEQTGAFVNTEEARKWLINKLGLKPEQVFITEAAMRMGNNPEVYGVTRVAADTLLGQIILSKKGREGIEYHEAWHYVNLLVHSNTEREILYREYLKQYPEYSNATKAELEEYLAEDFRTWMLTETKPRYIILKAFRRIKDFINKLFNRNDSLLSSVYKRIKNGQYAKTPLNEESIKEFKDAYYKGVYFSIPGITKEQQEKIKSITDPGTYYDVVDSLTNAAISLFGIRTQEDIDGLSDKFKMLLQILETSVESGAIPEGNENIAREVVANYDLFHSAVIDNLRELSIKEIETKDDETKASVDTGEVNPKEIFDRVAYEFSKKSNTSFNAKLFFYSIPKEEYVYNVDENGNEVRELQPVKDSIFGMGTTVPFDVVWNKIMDNLWSVETWEDIIGMSQELAKTDPFFQSLYNSLTGDNTPDENTQTQLLVTIKSAKNQLTTIQFEEAFEKSKQSREYDEAGDIKETVKAKAGNWTILSSENLRLIHKYPRQWSTLFYVSGMVNKEDPNDVHVDEARYKRIIKDYTNIKKELHAMAQDFIGKKRRPHTQDEVRNLVLQSKQQLVDILNTIGIPVDVNTIDYLLYNVDSVNENLPTISQFDKLFSMLSSSVPGNFTDSVFGNIGYLAGGKGRRQNKNVNYDNVFVGGEKSMVSQLAVAYGRTHPNPAEFSVTGPNNTTMYPISENNYIADQIRWANNDPNVVQEMLKSSYNKSSILMNGVANGAHLKLHTFIALKSKDTNESRDYFGISPIEDYISKMVFTHNNYITLPTMADKKTWYAISGVNLFHDLVSKTKTVDVFTEDGLQTEYQQLSDYRLSDSTIEAFYNYLVSEFNAINDYFANKHIVEQNPNLYIKNYHGKIKKGKMDASGNGGRFRYFSSLKMRTEDGTYKYFPLNQWLYQAELAEYNGVEGQVQRRLEQISNRLFDESNRQDIYDSINATLMDLIKNEVRQLNNLGIIKVTKEGSLVNKLIPENIIEEYFSNTAKLPKEHSSRRNRQDAIFSVIANHTINTIISVNEVERMFVGDPAYYKWQRNKKDSSIITERAVDKIKRLSSVLSTGSNLRTYWGEGDPRNNSKFTVMNLSDNNVVSNSYDGLYRLFKAAEIRRVLKKRNPNLTDEQLLKMTRDKQLEKTFSTFDKDTRNKIDASVSRQAGAYGMDDRGNGNINQADAAVYIRPALYKRIIQAVGEWSPKVEKAFELMESDTNWLSDPELYSQALETLIKPLKMVYFGNHTNSLLNLTIPVFDKMAIFPMFKVLANADNRIIYDRMNNAELGEIDMIAFESAIKVGSRVLVDAYDDAQNSKFNAENFNKPSTSTIKGSDIRERLDSSNSMLPTYIQDLKNLRLQMNTDPHEHTDRSFGTQVSKIALSNIVKDRVYGYNKGRKITGEQIINNVMGSIIALSDKGASSLKREFFNKDKELDKKQLSRFLKEQGKQSGLSTDAIMSMSYDPTTGEMIAPLSSLSTRKFIESRIVSQVGKKAVDINTPGGSAIQMAFFGFKKTHTLSQEDVSRAYNDGKPLKFLKDNGSMECMLSINFFRHVVPKEYQTDYTTMREWLLSKNIIGDKADPFAIGYRIPTQGLSSTASLVVADVLPAVMGDTIVVPDEFTAMTGSDFDIDKLYIASYWYDKDGNKIEFDETKDTSMHDIYHANNEKALVNRLLDMYNLVISDDSNIDETRAPLDNLTNILKKDILPIVQAASNAEAAPFYEALPSYQLSKKFEYTGGKMGIAPFALHSTNHAMTQAMGLKMDFGAYGSMFNLEQIDSITSQDGYRIMDWLSAMVNAHVDVAKDPYIMTLNVNDVTYNMTNFLLRTGKGTTTFYFLPQEILKDYVSEMLKANGVYGVDPNTSIANRKKDIINKLYNIYTSLAQKSIEEVEDPDLRDQYSDMLSNWKAFYAGKKINKEDTPKLANALDQSILKENLIKNNKGEKDFMYYYNQLLVFRTFNTLTPMSDTLNTLVQRSQIDTKKYGNTLALESNFYNQVQDFITGEQDSFFMTDANGKPLEVNALLQYYNNTFLSTKLEHAVFIPRQILKTQLITATYQYKNINNYVLGSVVGKTYTQDPITGDEIVRSKSTGNKDLVTQVADATETYLRTHNQQERMFNLTDEQINSMLFGDKSMCKRLFNLKHNIMNNPASYPELVDAEGNITNELLNYLIPVPATDKDVEGTADRIQLMNSSMSNSSNFENRLIAYFTDLLDSKDERIRNFANDLARYAYLTSNDNKGVNTFFHLVPMDWKMQHGYIESVKDVIQVLNNSDSMDKIITDIDNHSISSYPSISLSVARNNWNNETIVPTRSIPKSGVGSIIADDVLPNSISRKYRKGVKYALSFVDSKNSNSDFVKVSYDGNPQNDVLYVKVGKVKAFDKNDPSKPLKGETKTVYMAIPKLGSLQNGKLIQEYHKNYDEKSAFDNNNIQTLTSEQIMYFYNSHERGNYAISYKGLKFDDIIVEFTPNEYLEGGLDYKLSDAGQKAVDRDVNNALGDYGLLENPAFKDKMEQRLAIAEAIGDAPVKKTSKVLDYRMFKEEPENFKFEDNITEEYLTKKDDDPSSHC